jgi:hypothetical protein
MPGARFTVPFLVLALLAGAPVLSAQDDTARIRGRVTDSSGAALPGVTVTITPARPGRPHVVVTDRAGTYQSPPLEPGTYDLTFELSSFKPGTSAGVVAVGGVVQVVDQLLGLASLVETVTVVGTPPAPPPPAPLVPHVLPRPVPVAPEVLASVCGPARFADSGITIGRIAGSRDTVGRRLYGPSDVLLLDAGTLSGAVKGQNLVVRRRFAVGERGLPPKQATFGEHAAALIQVVEAGETSSIAVVVYACSEFEQGDLIEPFDALPMWQAKAVGSPRFDEPAHVLFGDDGQNMGAPGQLMVIDRGANHGAERGQRITVFRRAEGDRVETIADAVIVAVKPESATMRIERASDAVMTGDLAALHR